jgi:predicted acylesterase/phospholipase RssA
MDSNIVKELTGVLIKNIDESIIKEKNIDLILSGGAFNASYLIGCLYFIREMCDRGLICVNKVSTCSASSMVGLLFIVDKLDIFIEKMYELLVASFKKNRNVIFDEESLSVIIKII